MARLIQGLSPAAVRANLQAVREEVADACARRGRDPAEVEVLAAVKYVVPGELGVLVEAGVTLVGENRAQELEHKAALGLRAVLPHQRHAGHLQSRRVRQILPHVRLIHSVASDSVVRELGRLGSPDPAPPRRRVLVEVNVSGEAGKSGIAPAALERFLARCRAEGGVDVVGLMTMPPLAASPEDSRRWFAALAQLAADHGLAELSMGTTQDFPVAVEEGATIVRIGTRLYR